MKFSITLFLISWLVFIIFADKKKFFTFSPTCYLAIILGFVTDLLIHYYPLWSYPGSTDFQKCMRLYLDEFGVYFVVTYLFLQTLPKRKTFITIGVHIFLWTIPSILIEMIALWLESMKHDLWWSLYYSYFADWVLFFIFYLHHRLRVKHT
ncbi:CBO0543 family protein [Wukongibacter baidiensis]|uniref:CBO0543 family protein n=1 Tax=Wukongibacter baidiensis TaxID=1723361 RepID=UPI003D7FB311